MQNSKSRSLKEAQEKAIHAAKTLYELCDVGHKSNREPMVASGEYDVIGPLTQCLLHEPIYFHDHYSTSTSSIESSSSSAASLVAERTETQQEPIINDDTIDDSKGDNSEENKDDAEEKKDSGETADSTEDGSDSAKPITPSGEDTEDETPSMPANPPSLAEPEISTSSTRKIRKNHHRVDEKLHFVCLTLNNLSIPNDNKRVMVRERGAKRLIGNLCKVIKSGKKEAHLCCIILMNLSFYEPGLTIIGQFSPTKLSPIMPSSASSSSSAIPEKASSPTNPETNSKAGIENTSNGSSNSYKAAKAGAKALATTTTVLKRAAAVVSKPRKLTPLENPDSLLRILQDLLSTAERGTSDFRWAFGLLANLSRHPENALLIGLTGIPRVAIDNLRLAKTPSSDWATNSLEDFSSYFVLHLAEACPPASLKGALEVAMKIMNNSEDHYCSSENGNKHNGAANGESRNGDNNTNNTNDIKKDGSLNLGNHHRDNQHRMGIQNLKATMICAFLGLEWKGFPDHGVLAAGAVSELMGNTFERVGKKATYTDSDFSLRTAVSAYAALAKAAARADNIEASRSLASVEAKINKNTLTPGSAVSAPAPEPAPNGFARTSSMCVHTKVLALPTSVCLLFQIINAIALHWGDDSQSIGVGSHHSTGSNNCNEYYADTYHWDIKAGDLAVGAVMSLLPALLEGTGEPSMGSQQACADLSKMFVFFSKKTNSIAVRARSLEVAEKLTKSASGSALPLLEASYDLCRNFGIHRLQKNFL